MFVLDPAQLDLPHPVSPSPLDGFPSLLAAALEVKFSLFFALLEQFGDRLGKSSHSMVSVTTTAVAS